MSRLIPIRHLQGLLVVLSLCSTVGGQQPDSASVTVFDADGTTRSGELTALSDGQLTLSADQRRSWETTDLWKLEFPDRRGPRRIRGPVILLANGDRIIATPRETADGALRVHWQLAHEQPAVRIPLETIRGLLFRVPRADASRRRLFQTVHDGDRTNDTVLLNNGDRFDGEWLEFSEAGLTFEASVGKTEIDRDEIQAVAFNPLLVSFPDPAERRILVMLRDGSRITGGNPRLHDGRLALDASFGGAVEVPVSAVLSVRFLGGRVTYLSDLEPAESRSTPYLSGDWSVRRDRNVLGGPLRLHGREYPKGLGMHSRSVVTYDLGGRYRTFRSLIGLDDAAKEAGSAVFGVEVDGERRFTSEPLTGGDAPVTVPPVDVSGADRLTLIVDFGPWGDVMDRADWCDAVLVE